MAGALSSSDAFVANAPSKTNMQLQSVPFFADVVTEEPTTAEPVKAVVATPVVEAKAPPAPKAKSASKKKAPRKNAHEDGIFTPVVQVSKLVLGEERLNKIRGKAINIHSQVITSFIQTSGSKFGEFSLEQFFSIADSDGNGVIDKDELKVAFEALGFSVPPKQLDGIFARADKNKDGEIDLEEWKAAAPNTLKAQLIKLAKKNGAALGFLS